MGPVAIHNKPANAANNKAFFKKNSNESFFSSPKVNEPFFSGKSTGSAPIQAKLSIGEPGDKYEVEADAVADKVVQRLSTPDVQQKRDPFIQQKPIAQTITPLVQKKTALAADAALQKKETEENELQQESTPDEIQRKPVFETGAEPPDENQNDIQRKCADCEKQETLQRKEEEEKETVADKIQRKPAFESSIENNEDNNIQRQCADCEKEETLQRKEEEEKETVTDKIQRKPAFESSIENNEENSIQRKCADCEKEDAIQKKGDSSSSNSAASSIESRLSSSKGGGSPLHESIKGNLESSFGADFSNVRVHTDSSAVQMSKDLNAQAFTHGSDIYFNSGKYNTNDNAGKHLLAHELTHTVQQGKQINRLNTCLIQKAPGDSPTAVPVTNVTILDVNILDHMNRGNTAVATTFMAMRDSGVRFKISYYQYIEAIRPPADRPELGEAMRRMIQDLNIEVCSNPPRDARLDIATRGNRQITLRTYKDLQLTITAKLENASIWSMDTFYRNGYREIESVYGVRVRPESYTTPILNPQPSPDYRVGRLLAGLAPINLPLSAARPGSNGIPPVVYELDGSYERYVKLYTVTEAALKYGRYVSPSARFDDFTRLRNDLQQNLLEYVRIVNSKDPNQAQELIRIKNLMNQQNPLEYSLTPAYMRDIAELNRVGPHLDIYYRELAQARVSGRLSDAGINALWELDPPSARRFVENSGLSRSQQRAILSQLPGQPMPLRSRFTAGFLLVVELVNIASPFIQQKQQTDASENIGRALNDMLWWADKNINPEIQGVNDRWFRSNLWSHNPTEIFKWYKEGDLDYLALNSIPDNESTWTNFTIWISLNIKNYADWHDLITKSGAVKLDNDLKWKYRTSRIESTTFGHEIVEKWEFNTNLENILESNWAVMQTNTEGQIAQIGNRSNPQPQSELWGPGRHSTPAYRGIQQATGKKKFKASLSERKLYTIVRRRGVTDFPADSVFFTFPSNTLSGYNNASVPEGYVVVGGADFWTYTNIYSYSSGNPLYQPNREIMLAKIEDLEDIVAVQKKPSDVQLKAEVKDSNATQTIESNLNSSKGNGNPLPADTKQNMESSFGNDFSDIRIHTDNNAAQLSNDLGAQAFTHGSDIYFNSGKFDTNSSKGQHLLAHELTHTVQQGGDNLIQRSPLLPEENDAIEARLDMMITTIRSQLPSYAGVVETYLETKRRSIESLQHENFAEELIKWDTSVNNLSGIIQLAGILPEQNAVLPELLISYTAFKYSLETALLGLASTEETIRINELVLAKDAYMSDFSLMFINSAQTVLSSLPSEDAVDESGYFIQGVFLTPNYNGHMEFGGARDHYYDYIGELNLTKRQIRAIGDLWMQTIVDGPERLAFLVEKGDSLMELMQRVKALTLLQVCFTIGNQFLEYVWGDYQQRFSDVGPLIELRDSIVKNLINATRGGKVPSDDVITQAQEDAGNPTDFINASAGKTTDVQRPHSIFAIAGSRIHDVMQLRQRMEIFVSIASTLMGIRAMTLATNALKGSHALVRFTLSSLAFTGASSGTRILLTGKLPTLKELGLQAVLDMATFGAIRSAHALVGIPFGGAKNIPPLLEHTTTFTTLWVWSSAVSLAMSDEEFTGANFLHTLGQTGPRLAIELPLIMFMHKALNAPSIVSETSIGRSTTSKWNETQQQMREAGNRLKSWLEEPVRDNAHGERLFEDLLSHFGKAKSLIPELFEAGIINKAQLPALMEQFDSLMNLGGTARNVLRLGIKPAGDYGFFYRSTAENMDMFLRRQQGQGALESVRVMEGRMGKIFEARYTDGTIKFFFPEGANQTDHIIDVDIAAETMEQVAPQVAEPVRNTALATLRHLPAAEANQVLTTIEANQAADMVVWLARADVATELTGGNSPLNADFLGGMASDPQIRNRIMPESARALHAWFRSGFERTNITNAINRQSFLDFLTKIEEYHGNLDVGSDAEARSIVDRYLQSGEGSEFIPRIYPEPPSIRAIGGPVAPPKPFKSIDDYLIQNNLINGDFIKSTIGPNTYVIRSVNGVLDHAWIFGDQQLPPNNQVMLGNELNTIQSAIEVIESQPASQRTSLANTIIRPHYNLVEFINRIRIENQALNNGKNILDRAAGLFSPQTSAVASTIPTQQQALRSRQLSIRERSASMGLQDDPLIRTALNRRPTAATQPATLSEIGTDLSSAENRMNELNRAAIARTSTRLGRNVLRNLREQFPNLTDQQVGDVLNLTSGLQGIGPLQVKGLLYVIKDGSSVAKLFELARSAAERNFVLENYSRFRDANLSGTTRMFNDMLSSNTSWRGGVWALEYASTHLSLDQIRGFEVTDFEVTPNGQTYKLNIRRYDIELRDGRRLEMKDWSRWFPESLKSQFKRDVLIRTGNFTIPEGIVEMEYLFKWPGPQLSENMSLTTEATIDGITDLFRQGLNEVITENNAPAAAAETMREIFERRTDMVRIVESVSDVPQNDSFTDEF